MRIVSLSPSSTEIAFALGAGEDVIAVTHLCDYPFAAQRRARVGSWVHTDPEQLTRLRPDIILTTNYVPEELRSHDALSQRVLTLEPSSLASVLESILEVGWHLGRYTAAEELVGEMQKSLEVLRSSQPVHQLRVYCEERPDPPTRAGYWVPEIVELAGGIPIGGVHANPSSPVQVDALRAEDPDLMVFHWCNPGESHDPQQVAQRPGWEDFRAVRSQAFAFIPHDILNRPGPRLVDGARALQGILHAHQRSR